MESIIAANGSNELMYTALMAIVGKGTKVLIPSPTFFLYEKIVKILEGDLISVLAKDDLTFDVERIIATAEKRTAVADRFEFAEQSHGANAFDNRCLKRFFPLPMRLFWSTKRTLSSPISLRYCR